MYFVLSKVLLFLLVPFNWVLALLVIAIFKRSHISRRRYLIAALIMVYIFSIPLLFKGFTRIWDIKTDPLKTDGIKYSAVIVLGGFAGEGNVDGGQFNRASDRFITGLMLLKTGKARQILITGGNGSLAPDAFREGPWVGTQLKKLGIADSLILIEGNSRNTLENAEFSKKMLLANKLQPPYLLVTSAFHMRRAAMIFNKKGMRVIPQSSNYLTDNNHFNVIDIIPAADTLSSWELYLKEMVGYVINYFSK